MPKTILLIKVTLGKTQEVMESLREKGISARVVSGSYDIIAEADSDPTDVITQVTQINGIEKVDPQFV